MKVLSLARDSLNIQRCLLPDCEFLQDNYGRYCVVTEGQRSFLVKIGLCEVKCLGSAIFLDDSVSVFSSVDKIRRVEHVNEITFDDFTILSKPLFAKVIRLVVVFADLYDVKKHKGRENILRKVLRDILRVFTFCSNSSICLSNLLSNQRFGINSIVILDADGSRSNQIFRVDASTEIVIERCVSQLKFDQSLKNANELPLGGCSRAYGILKEMIWFLQCSQKNKLIFVNKLLLIGPSGCGKTTLVRTVSSECNCILLEISASAINALNPGEVEKKLTNVFEQAKVYVEDGDCCVVLIEDIDLISSGRSSHARRFVGKLITLLEDIDSTSGILVIATTNSPDEVDSQLRRAKRLEDELEIMIPTAEERVEILKQILNHCDIRCDDKLLHQVSHWTPGFVGSDLKLIIQEALMVASKKNGTSALPDNDSLLDCFKEALKKVIPSALRGALGLCLAKDVNFSQIGGLENIKSILDLSVKQQLENPGKFERLGIPLTKGILLYGPPGCAKTTLVKALARECNATFLATSAADLYSPFVGDAEKKIVQLFTQARLGSPTILFIDEIDAVVGSKSGDRERGVQERILSTLLIEMDGVGLKVNTQRDNSLKLLGEAGDGGPPREEINNGVVVIGATNRPQLLDDALKRPGRFDRLLYVPPPDESERLAILLKLTEKMRLHESVDLHRLAKETSYYSGADLKNLCQESGLYALNSSDMSADCIRQAHFEHVLNEYRPSLSEKVVAFYESYQMHNI